MKKAAAQPKVSSKAIDEMDDRILTQSLLQLTSSGKKSFEELVANLLSALTGQHFRLAKSGYQAGRDMTSRDRRANIIAVECKRYGGNTQLNKRELLGEISQINRAIPDLDLWVLVTSREVDSVLYEELRFECTEHGVDFVSIADADGDPSSLATLCASSLGTVLEFFASNNVDTNLDQLNGFLVQTTRHSLFEQSLSALKSELCSPMIGYDNWRTKQNEVLTKLLESHDLSRAEYGQDLGVAAGEINLIEREKVWAFINEWLEDWRNLHRPLVVLGEEGDGKTWCVAAWLYERMAFHKSSFPAVVWLPSFESIESEPEKVASEAIERVIRTNQVELWQKRLGRWLSGASLDDPILFLVIDGINQHQDTEWLRLLEKLTLDPRYHNQIAVIVTCRTVAWDRYDTHTLHSRFLTVTVEPYNDAELAKALSNHELSLSDYPSELMKLVRKPRYLDLMVKHRERMAMSGDVTVERLIYEDWRDRLSRKTNIMMGDEDFQDFICELAEDFRNNRVQPRLSANEIERNLPPLTVESKLSVLDELITGGIFKRDGRKYTIDDKVICLGLALLLVDQMRQSLPNSASSDVVEEYLAEWLEPLSESDLKAKILGFACLHLLTTGVLEEKARAVILHTWITSPNPSPTIEDDFTSYLPLDVGTYTLMAEIVWSDRTENSWAQDLFLRSIRHWAGTEKVKPILAEHLEKWLSLVHIFGHPHQRGRDDEKAKEIQGKIAARAGMDLRPGSFSYAKREFTAVEDDGLMRLGRFSLAIISCMPRDDFISGIATGCVAESLMDHPAKYELFKWILSTAENSLWDEVEGEARNLIQEGTEVTLQAAHRLLSFEGSQLAYDLQESLPDNLFPSREWLAELRKDPCTAGFSWSKEDCTSCIWRTDIEASKIARSAGPFCTDPSLEGPEDLGSRLTVLIDEVDIKEIDSVLATTMSDHNFRDFEPIFCVFAPNTWASFVRLLASEIPNRRGLSLRLLSIRLLEHHIVLGEVEQEALFTTWKTLFLDSKTISEEDLEGELWLFLHVLQGLAAEDQLRYLLARNDRWKDLEHYEYSFKQPTTLDGVISSLMNETSPISQRRLLWYLSAFGEFLSPLQVQQFLHHLAST